MLGGTLYSTRDFGEQQIEKGSPNDTDHYVGILVSSKGFHFLKDTIEFVLDFVRLIETLRPNPYLRCFSWSTGTKYK